ncbi:CDGP domain-containing protein [Mycobacterium sp. URHB0021]
MDKRWICALRSKLLCDGPIQPDGSWQRCLPLKRGQPYCWLLRPRPRATLAYFSPHLCR